jgi:hypothetical protein
VFLLTLLVLAIGGAIAVIGGLLGRVEVPVKLSRPDAVLVGRQDGLFLGDGAAAGARPIFDGGSVLAVERSPSSARIAVRYVPDPHGIGPSVTVAVLDAGGAPIPGSERDGRLRSLPAARDGVVPDSGDIAWAPSPVRGHEALAVGTGFGVLVVDETGTPLAEARIAEEGSASMGSGVSWSRADATGTVRLAWGVGSSVWLMTIPALGPITTTELVDLRVADAIRHASPRGERISTVAISPDGTRVAAVISGCGFACRAGLWLVDDRGGTRLLDGATQTDAWLTFTDDGRSVLAGLWGDGAGRLALVPVDGGRQVDLHLEPPGLLGDDTAYPLHARWLAGTGRILVGAPAEASDGWSELTPVGLDFWSVAPGGADFERVARGAFAVDLAR